MAIKVIKSFRWSIISNRLKKYGSREAWDLLSIVWYLFLDPVQELIAELDAEFDSKYGPKAYPRTLVIGVLMFAISQGKTSLQGIEDMCEDSKVINLFTSGFNPKEDVFRRLLTDAKQYVLKKIFLYSLIIFNEYKWLELTKLFVDGTDALVNASKHYIIHSDEIENVKKIKALGLIHNGKKGSTKLFKKKLIIAE